jgi:tetratricopeptide (TPR) repeat protein
VDLEPEYAAGKNNLGSAYLLAGKWDEAIKVFKELNNDLIYATPHFSLYNLGWAYYNKNEYETAIEYFNKSLKAQHGFVLALRGLGLTYRDMGNIEMALDYFLKATEKSPQFPQLYMDLGDVYIQLKKYDQAIEAFTEVARMKPDTEIADQANKRIAEAMKLITR